MNIQFMNGLYGDVISLVTIDAAGATLPHAGACSDWVLVVDVISQKGAAVTLEFERVRCGTPGSPTASWRWEVVYCYPALTGRKVPVDSELNRPSRR